MFLLRALLLKPRASLSHEVLTVPSVIHRTLTCSPQLQPKSETDTNRKPLLLLFQEAVGLCEKTEENIESVSEDNELQKKLWALEKEVRDLKEAELKNDEENNNVMEKKIKNKNVKKEILEKPKSLYAAFSGSNEEGVEMTRKETRKEPEKEARIFKELSPEMKVFVSHLYKEGYFNDANFCSRGKLEFSCFDDSYGRGFIKFAAEKFGKDHQEIAKWLSGSDLKKVALFGCPSLLRKNIFSAKRLRKYFEIQENTVCGKCVLKHSCKFVNQSVWNSGDTKKLELAAVMKVITLYALEAVHPELSVTDEIKASVSRLLNDVLKLSQTTSRGY